MLRRSTCLSELDVRVVNHFDVYHIASDINRCRCQLEWAVIDSDFSAVESDIPAVVIGGRTNRRLVQKWHSQWPANSTDEVARCAFYHFRGRKRCWRRTGFCRRSTDRLRPTVILAYRQVQCLQSVKHLKYTHNNELCLLVNHVQMKWQRPQIYIYIYIYIYNF